MYHQHPEADRAAELETKFYAQADTIREQLLSRPLAQSNASIPRVAAIVNNTNMDFESLEPDPTGHLGLETDKFVYAINDCLQEVLLVNATYLWDLRGRVRAGLTEEIQWKVGDDATGDEFEATLRAQTELDTYFNAYHDALVDRRELLTDLTTFVREIERRPKTARKGPAGALAANASQQEESQLLRALQKRRRVYREASQSTTSITSLIAELSEFSNQTTYRMEERHLAKTEQQRLKKIKEDQLDLVRRLESEEKAFTRCFNTRLVFFMTLQQISDTLIDQDAAAVERETALALEDPKAAERQRVQRLKERENIITAGPAQFNEQERRIATTQAHARYVSDIILFVSNHPMLICW